MSLGRAGELWLMSEFILRGYNVARPEIDIGYDLIVSREANLKSTDPSEHRPKSWLIQVKTTTCRPDSTPTGYVTSNNLKLNRLRQDTATPTYYVFLNRLNDEWQDPIIIPGYVMRTWLEKGELGNCREDRETRTLKFTYREGTVKCCGKDITRYINDWRHWPKLYDREQVMKEHLALLAE